MLKSFLTTKLNISRWVIKRASIAHALIGSPKLIVLDEPFNGLDAGGVDDVLALIKNLNREENMSFVSSHQLPYLETFAVTQLFYITARSVPAEQSNN